MEKTIPIATLFSAEVAEGKTSLVQVQLRNESMGLMGMSGCLSAVSLVHHNRSD